MNANSLVSLLWWVVIGGLFFWMMQKGGCGMGHAHGGHGASADPHPEHGPGHGSGRPIDPVCGMELDPARAAGTRLVAGWTFFFCSQTCLDAFDENPNAYADPQPARAGADHPHAGH